MATCRKCGKRIGLCINCDCYKGGGKMNNVVIYHADCVDGFTSAYLFWKFYDGGATFIPMHYPCKELENIDNNTHVWFLDFSASYAQTKALCKKAALVTILDHHKTARDTILELTEEGIENLEVTFDMERSGCRIVWDFMHNNPDTISTINTFKTTATGKTPPNWVVAYAEDRDLWRFKLDNSKEINAYMRCCEMTFEGWEALTKLDPNVLTPLGSAILSAEAKQVERIVKTAYMGEITGPNGTVYTVPIVNTQTHISEVLHELAKQHIFAVAWWEDGKTRKYSLRVDSKTNFDGTIIARHHKGGGHAKACGWTECVK